jgi:filamentous hemagglutinin family protein
MKELKRSKSALLIAAALLAAGHAAANPTGATVVHGNVTLQTSGNHLTVTNSPGTIINWQSFSVGSQEVTRFNQTSSSSAVLNRVTGGNPSAILGQLQSNGKVFVANPNGVMFGAGAQVSTASFMATTGQFSDASFLAGGSTPTGGSTLHVGSLNVGTGLVSLSGGSVTINGSVSVTGDLSVMGDSMNLSGDISVNNVQLTAPGAPISVGGGNITVTNVTTGVGSSDGDITVIRGNSKATIAVAGGSTTSAPSAFAATRSVSSPGTNVSAVAGRHVAPISARPALFVLEKREPLF